LFSYVGQDVSLFNDTIENNIIYNLPECNHKDVVESAKKAHADEFIDRIEGGYKYHVGQYGVNLSGGQKQRIIMARAFLHNRPCLILDEATSSLDSISERYIQDALHNLLEKKTSIIIAHRLSTIKEADNIFVINNGTLAESGNHEQLMARGESGLYATFYNTQYFE